MKAVDKILCAGDGRIWSLRYLRAYVLIAALHCKAILDLQVIPKLTGVVP
jgi:hypothetical protein